MGTGARVRKNPSCARKNADCESPRAPRHKKRRRFPPPARPPAALPEKARMNRSTICVALVTLALATAVPAQAWLQAPREVVSQIGHDIRAIGDLDSDGDPDLLVAAAILPTVGFTTLTPYYTMPDGRFAAGTPITAFPAGDEGSAYVRIGDVTGDGLPDITTSLRDFGAAPGHGFLVYRNLGAGAFAPPIHTPTVGDPQGAALSDWNGDGTFEIVETHRVHPSGGMQRWTFDGERFQPSNALFGALEFEHVTIGEVTGDSLPDAVVGNAFRGEIYVVATLPGGDLATPVVHAVGAPTLLHGRYPACGDLDGDGDTDILVGWTEFGDPAHLLQLTNDGSGGLTVEADQVLGDPGASADGIPHLTDVDGDGDLDALVCWKYLLFAENVGDGVYAGAGLIQVARRWAFPSGQLRDGNNGAGIADFNGDGRPDLATGRVIAFGGGGFGATTWRSIASVSHQAVDLDGDGDLDMIEAGGDVRTNDGTGWFTDAGTAFPPLAFPLVYREAHALADFNGDGHEDIVATLLDYSALFGPPTFRGMRMLEGSPAGSFRDRGMPTASVVSLGAFDDFSFRHCDLDGDGDVDLAEAGGWWENDGTGFFASRHAAWVGRPALAGDVDDNGTQDVVTYVESGSTSSYLLQRNDGGGVRIGDARDRERCEHDALGSRPSRRSRWRRRSRFCRGHRRRRTGLSAGRERRWIIRAGDAHRGDGHRVADARL